MKTTLTVLLITNLYGLVSCATKHHYFINQTMTWEAAELHCRNYYHGLSTFIDQTEEQQFILHAVNQTSKAWVGLYKGTGLWKWTGGELASRVSWDVDEPGNFKCALVNLNKKLGDNICTESFTFFCMTLDFVVVQQSESWEGALEYCRHHHDDLASLSTNNRMTDTFSKIPEAQTQYVWIGLRFLAGEWFWISGDDLQYEVWSSPGKPQCPAQNQRCGALDKITMTWTNRDCEEKLNFLCV